MQCYLGNEKERCYAISHCWSDDNIVYLGCKKGFLLMLDWESRKISILMDCNLHEQQFSDDNLNIIHEGNYMLAIYNTCRYKINF